MTTTPETPGTDLAVRVTQAMQQLTESEQRTSWQDHIRGGFLGDAQTLALIAEALESDARHREVDGDLPFGWSATLRAKRRSKPAREAARHLRAAAKAIGGTVAAIEATDPATIDKDRRKKAHDKALRKGAARGQAAALVTNQVAQTLNRLNPAETGDDQAAEQSKDTRDWWRKAQ